MKEDVHPLNLDLVNENLLDLDFKSIGDFVGITDNNKIILPYFNFQIDFNFIYPLIGKINQNLLLVVDVRSIKRNKNGYIFNSQGELINQFYAGDGIENIKILGDKIIISYFDEGVMGDLGPNNEGLSVFDLNGEYLFGYNEKHGELIIFDCYCMCKFDNQKILFLAYSDFKLIELNINTYEEKTYQIPTILRGSVAMTSWKNKVYFYSPYDDKGGIYEWEFGSESANKIGSYDKFLKDFGNGRFISFEKGHEFCTIVDVR